MDNYGGVTRQIPQLMQSVNLKASPVRIFIYKSIGSHLHVIHQR